MLLLECSSRGASSCSGGPVAKRAGCPPEGAGGPERRATPSEELARRPPARVPRSDGRQNSAGCGDLGLSEAAGVGGVKVSGRVHCLEHLYVIYRQDYVAPFPRSCGHS